MRIHRGSILDVEADVIVNPANGHLRHEGGLARIIEQAATRRDVSAQDGREREASIDARAEWMADHAQAGLVATGNAVLTSPGSLPFKACVHAVGPIWNGGRFFEQQLLQSAHLSALNLAERAGFKSIAVPAVSCGIFGYPVEQAAHVAVGVADLSRLDVTFALMEEAHVDAYAAAMASLAILRAG